MAAQVDPAQTVDTQAADTPAMDTQVVDTQAEDMTSAPIEGRLTCITQIPTGQLNNDATTEFLGDVQQYNGDGNAHIGIVKAFDVHRHFWSENSQTPNHIMVIDCRSVAEYDAGHIDGALNFPLTLPEGSATFKQIGADPSGGPFGPLIEGGATPDAQPNTNSLVLHCTKPQEVEQLVFYCDADQLRSSALALWYKQSELAGTKELLVMFGGLPAWQHGGGMVVVPVHAPDNAEAKGDISEDKPDTTGAASSQTQSAATTENGDHPVATPTTSAEASQVLPSPPQAEQHDHDGEIPDEVATHKWIPGTEPSPEEQAALMPDLEHTEPETAAEEGGQAHAAEASGKANDHKEEHEYDHENQHEHLHADDEETNEQDRVDYDEYKRWEAYEREHPINEQDATAGELHGLPAEAEGEGEAEHHHVKEDPHHEKQDRLEFERFKRWEAFEREHGFRRGEELRMEREMEELLDAEEETALATELVRCEHCHREVVRKEHVRGEGAGREMGMRVAVGEKGRGKEKRKSQFLLLRLDEGKWEGLSVWRFGA